MVNIDLQQSKLLAYLYSTDCLQRIETTTASMNRAPTLQVSPRSIVISVIEFPTACKHKPGVSSMEALREVGGRSVRCRRLVRWDAVSPSWDASWPSCARTPGPPCTAAGCTTFQSAALSASSPRSHSPQSVDRRCLARNPYLWAKNSQLRHCPPAHAQCLAVPAA